MAKARKFQMDAIQDILIEDIEIEFFDFDPRNFPQPVPIKMEIEAAPHVVFGNLTRSEVIHYYMETLLNKQNITISFYSGP